MPHISKLLTEKYLNLHQESLGAGLQALQQKIIDFFSSKSPDGETMDGPDGPYTSEDLMATLDTLDNATALTDFAKWLGMGGISAVEESQEPLKEMAALYQQTLPIPKHGEATGRPAAQNCIAIKKGLRVRGLQTNPPAPGEKIGMVYNHKGEYMGWCSLADAQKFFYERGLHYHGHRMYSMKAYNHYTFSNGYKVDKLETVIERDTKNNAMFVTWRNLHEAETVDKNDKAKAARATLKLFKDKPVSEFNSITDIKDPLNLLTPVLAKAKAQYKKTEAEAEAEAAQKKEAASAQYKKTLIDYLEKMAASADIMDQTAKDTGIDLDV